MKFSLILSAAASVALANPSKTTDQTGEQIHPNVQYSVYNAQNQFNALTNTVNQLANVQTKNTNQDQHLAWQLNGLNNAVGGANSALSNVSMNCFLWNLVFKCHSCNRGCTGYSCPMPVPQYIPPPPPPCATCPPGSTTIWVPDGMAPPTYPQRGRMFKSSRYAKVEATKDSNRVMNIISGPVANHLSPVMKAVSQGINTVSGQLQKYKSNPYVNNEARKLLSSIETLADNSHEFQGAARERSQLLKAANKLRAVLSY